MAALLAGCAATGVTLPELPAWIPVADSAPLSPADVAAAARQYAPAARITLGDASYVPVSHAWLVAYVDWTWHAAKAAGIAYTPESFDCDDFAVGFHFFASRAAAKAGVHSAPLIARLVVELPAASFLNSQPSALNSSRRHELIGVATERGLYIVEPQPSAGPFRITPLAEYPNRILSITLGDFNP
jgi:hypothetical protein